MANDSVLDMPFSNASHVEGSEDGEDRRSSKVLFDHDEKKKKKEQNRREMQEVWKRLNDKIELKIENQKRIAQEKIKKMKEQRRQWYKVSLEKPDLGKFEPKGFGPFSASLVLYDDTQES